MAKIQDADFVPVEHDTFLDIVTNVVGILVILVMLVGLQARDAPASASVPKNATELAKAGSAAADLEHEVAQLRNEAVRLAASVQERQVERQVMANLKVDTDREVADYRTTLDAQAREKFDLNRRLAAATARIDDLDRRRVQLAAADGPVLEVKNYPTPLGKTVFGHEVHFQLRGGRLAHVPLDALLEDAGSQAQQKLWKLQSPGGQTSLMEPREDRTEITEMVGPREGFRMRYTLEKKAATAPDGRRGYRISGKQFDLIPVNSSLGEPVEAALEPGSQFNQLLSTMEPGQTTITFWTYPDSFSAFRKLKEELYRRGYATAGRPLTDGALIGGSPEGTRTAAE